MARHCPCLLAPSRASCLRLFLTRGGCSGLVRASAFLPLVGPASCSSSLVVGCSGLARATAFLPLARPAASASSLVAACSGLGSCSLRFCRRWHRRPPWLREPSTLAAASALAFTFALACCLSLSPVCSWAFAWQPGICAWVPWPRPFRCGSTATWPQSSTPVGEDTTGTWLLLFADPCFGLAPPKQSLP